MKNFCFKKIFLLFVAILLICCSSSKHVLKDTDDEETEMEGVAFGAGQTVYPVSVTAIEVSVWNDTKSPLYVNEYYTLYYYTGSDWKGIELDMAFIDIIYSLEPDERRFFTVSLPHSRFDFVPGKYMVKKTVFSDEETFELSAEFTLE